MSSVGITPGAAAAMRTIDMRAFWQAAGLRATGAAIVTAEAGGGPRGFYALSATHLSADPPLMMVSVNERTSALPTLLEAAHFAINYLSASQTGLVAAFSGKGDLKGSDRFSSAQWTTLATGAPVLAAASGAVDCTVEDVIRRAGTAIVIGRVVDFTAAADPVPLVAYRGAYL